MFCSYSKTPYLCTRFRKGNEAFRAPIPYGFPTLPALRASGTSSENFFEKTSKKFGGYAKKSLPLQPLSIRNGSEARSDL